MPCNQAGPGSAYLEADVVVIQPHPARAVLGAVQYVGGKLRWGAKELAAAAITPA
jgi:hypothetical protein